LKESDSPISGNSPWDPRREWRLAGNSVGYSFNQNMVLKSSNQEIDYKLVSRKDEEK
jgi:hypothetical protein